jgi:hypothetical protein
MIEKPGSITTIGIVQIILAATFVIWLLFFPSRGVDFAWPIIPTYSAMFIGAGFIARTYIGFFLWRDKHWADLKWQVKANYAFLFIIWLATYWHIEEMNWESNIIVAHIWVLAYTIEPILLFLYEPRSREDIDDSTEILLEGPVSIGLKRVAVFGLVVAITIAGLLFINPKFMDTRWPWPLDPFDARIMAAFLALNAGWCYDLYFAQDWGRIKRAVIGMILFSLTNFIVWVISFPNFDYSRENIYTFGIAFFIFTVLLALFYIRQERKKLQFSS